EDGYHFGQEPGGDVARAKTGSRAAEEDPRCRAPGPPRTHRSAAASPTYAPGGTSPGRAPTATLAAATAGASTLPGCEAANSAHRPQAGHAFAIQHATDVG